VNVWFRNANTNLYLAAVVVFVTGIKVNSSSSGIADASELG
jgi:outer membrane cobalamin receptor